MTRSLGSKSSQNHGPSKKSRAPTDPLLLSFLIIGWILMVVLVILIIVYYARYASTVSHASYAFATPVPKWQPRGDIGALSAAPFPNTYLEDVSAFLGDQMTRYMEYYEKDVPNYVPRLGTSIGAEIFTDNGKQLSCMVIDAPLDDAAVVLFKGTTTNSEWKVDFDYKLSSPGSSVSRKDKLRAWKNHTLPSRFRSNFSVSPPTADSSGVLLHNGFLEFYLEMRAQILSALNDLGRSTIYVCGHSLGAALSNVCTYDLIKTGFRETPYIYCVTIAAPRVGNPDFATWMKTADARLFQLRNVADLVPQAPFVWTPSLSGEKQLYAYEHAGVGMLFHDMSVNMLGVHMLDPYQRHTSSVDLTMFTQ